MKVGEDLPIEVTECFTPLRPSRPVPILARKETMQPLLRTGMYPGVSFGRMRPLVSREDLTAPNQILAVEQIFKDLSR